MENSSKKKYTVEIAGNPLTLVSDEPETFVKSVAGKLNDRMRELTKSSFRITQLDAAMLCALDYLAEELKAEKRIRALESQLELYEVNMKNMREELERYRSAETAADGARDRVREIGEALRSDEGTCSEDKIRALEKYLESKKSADRRVNPDERTREEKIKYIESLLRGTDKTDK